MEVEKTKKIKKKAKKTKGVNEKKRRIKWVWSLFVATLIFYPFSPTFSAEPFYPKVNLQNLQNLFKHKLIESLKWAKFVEFKVIEFDLKIGSEGTLKILKFNTKTQNCKI